MRGVFNSDTTAIPADASLQSALTLRDGRMFWTLCRAQHWAIIEYLMQEEPNIKASDVMSAGWLQNGVYNDDESGYSMQCIRDYFLG